MRLESVIQRDTRVLQPAATAVPIGTLYFVTVEEVLERSNGTIWESYGSSGGGVAADNIIPNPRLKKSVWTTYQRTVNTTVGSGTTVSNVDGTISDGGDSTRPYVTLSTSTSGVSLGYSPTGAVYDHAQSRYNPTFHGIIKTGPSIANFRFFIGLTDRVLGALLGSDTPLAHFIGLRYSSVIGPNWFIYSSDSATGNSVDAGVVVTVDTAYEIKLWSEDAGVTWWASINNSTPVSLAALTSPTVWLAMTGLGRNLAAEAKAISFSRLYVKIN